MKIFVLIVTYNGTQWLEKCLSSVSRSNLPLDIVVVDNNSSDNTLEIVSKFNISRLFALDQNLGFGKANNIGLKYAMEQDADYVFLLNQDAYIRPDTMERLVEVSQRHPEYFVLSPIHLEGTETKLDLNFQNYVSPKNCHGLLSDLALQNGNLRDVYETTFVNAALWLLPKACLTRIGGFDPIFAHYGEDNDFIRRVRYHGFKAGVCPKAFGVHDRAQRNDFVAVPYRKKTLKRLKTDALIKLKDINRPLGPILRPLYTSTLKHSIKSMFSLNLAELGKLLSLLSFTTRNLSAARKHRKISKQETGGAWLDQSTK
jgi:GT2 family glycosyltransferase